MPSPRILYLSPWWSGTPRSASEARALHVGKALQQIGNVEVVVVHAPEREAQPDDNAGGFRVRGEVATAAHTRRAWTDKSKWLMNPRFPYPHGVAVDSGGAQWIRHAASEFDLLWFFKLRTANVFPDWAWPRSVMDIDDLPSLFERSVLTSNLSRSERIATRLRMWSWQRRERLLGERFSVLSVCSEADRSYLRQLGVRAPVQVIANGFERPETPPLRRAVSPARLGFIGVFDHAPNAAGVDWFVRHCWPVVKRQIPDARLRLIGRLTDGPLKPHGPDVDALGYVADPNDEISTWSGMIVPVHTGAGTRGKIAHAFSRKCPVVSTPLGAYGYDPTDGEDMLLAESVEQFADACIFVVRRPDAAAQIAERAWERFLTQWTWDAVSGNVRRTAELALQTGRAAAARTHRGATETAHYC